MTVEQPGARSVVKKPWFFTTLVTSLLLLYPLFGQMMPGESGIASFMLGFYLLLVWFVGQRGWSRLKAGAAGLWWLLLAGFAMISYLLLTDLPTQTVTVLLLSVAAMLAASITTEWIKTSLRVVLVFVSIHALATLVFYAVPSLYFGVFKPRFFPGVIMANGYQAGLTSHYSYNAMFCAIGLLLAGALALFGEAGRRARWTNWSLSMLFLLALFLTTKRAHIVLAVLALLLVYLFSNANAKMLKIIIAVALGLAGVLWVASFNEGVATALTRLTESFQESGDLREVTSGRTLLWEAAFAGWRLSPIIGLGWQSYHFIWPAGVTESFHAHNQVINLLYEGGIIGLALYAVAALAAMIVGVRVLVLVQRDDAIPRWQRPAAAFGVSMQLFIMMYANSTGELLHSAYVFIPYFLSVAIAVAIWADVRRQRSAENAEKARVVPVHAEPIEAAALRGTE